MTFTMKTDSSDPKAPIYTIGYGSRQVGELIALLQGYRIAYLLDIRSKPFSKFNPDFNRPALEAHLAGTGIKYVYMGDTLGGRPDLASCYTPDGKVDYASLREKDFYRRGIQRLRDAWQQGRRVALMCSEARPEMCHRSKLIGETLAGEGIEVAHIDENGQALTQPQTLLRLSGGQLGLPGFAAPGLTSRKSYLETGEENDD